MNHLIFTLYSPLQSWGTIAIGERRETFTHPSKSSILGLVGASLGIPRNTSKPHVIDQQHLELQNSLGFAVAIQQPGVLISDFHTTQVSKKNRTPLISTRMDEIEFSASNKPNISNIISYRDYLCDAIFIICLWCKDSKSPISLEKISRTLKQPQGNLYLGRKSCPPALPLNPQIIEAKSLYDAFFYFKKRNPNEIIFSNKILSNIKVYWDHYPNHGIENIREKNTRRDLILSRCRWQFQNRTEFGGILSWKSNS